MMLDMNRFEKSEWAHQIPSPFDGPSGEFRGGPGI